MLVMGRCFLRVLQICSFSAADEVIKVLACLSDKVLDMVFTPPPRNEAVLRCLSIS
jgi:hypothetical protein